MARAVAAGSRASAVRPAARSTAASRACDRAVSKTCPIASKPATARSQASTRSRSAGGSTSASQRSRRCSACTRACQASPSVPNARLRRSTRAITPATASTSSGTRPASSAAVRLRGPGGGVGEPAEQQRGEPQPRLVVAGRVDDRDRLVERRDHRRDVAAGAVRLDLGGSGRDRDPAVERPVPAHLAEQRHRQRPGRRGAPAPSSCTASSIASASGGGCPAQWVSARHSAQQPVS